MQDLQQTPEGVTVASVASGKPATAGQKADPVGFSMREEIRAGLGGAPGSSLTQRKVQEYGCKLLKAMGKVPRHLFFAHSPGICTQDP